jgi:hypothetical protein
MYASAKELGAFTVTERVSRRTMHLVGRSSKLKRLIFPAERLVPAVHGRMAASVPAFKRPLIVDPVP